jgi:hypothetical protein
VVEQPIRNPTVDITVVWNQQFTFGLFGSIWLIRDDLEGLGYSLCTDVQALHLIFNFVTQRGQNHARGATDGLIMRLPMAEARHTVAYR